MLLSQLGIGGDGRISVRAMARGARLAIEDDFAVCKVGFPQFCGGSLCRPWCGRIGREREAGERSGQSDEQKRREQFHGVLRYLGLVARMAGDRAQAGSAAQRWCMRQHANGGAAPDDVGRDDVAQLEGCRRIQHHDVRVASPRGTIDQDGEALDCKLVGTGRLPAIGAPAALNLVRAAELDNLPCTPAVLKTSVLLVEIGAARQTDRARDNENPARNRTRDRDGAIPHLLRVDRRQRRSRSARTDQGASMLWLASINWQSRGH